MPTTRRCTLCQEDKPLDQFDGKTTYYCKPCRKEYRSSEREKKTARALHLKRMYGMTLEEFNLRADNQRGRCAICQKVPEKVLRVDHDHATGMVRSLLCDDCNVGLGKFQDNPALLQAALNYVLEWSKNVAA